MTIFRPYAQIYDSNDNTPVQTQLDNPAAGEFTTEIAVNAHTYYGASGREFRIADGSVSPRGSKRIVWSTEGYNWHGIAIPALTAGQKAATGSSATNIGAATPPGGVTLPTVLDFSFYRYLQLILVLTSLTGGSSPTIQFELDFLDDTSPTANKFALWNPIAQNAAASFLVQAGSGMTVPPASAPTGYANAAVPAGWTVYSIPLVIAPNGKFAWTVTGSPTAIAWNAWLYGQY